MRRVNFSEYRRWIPKETFYEIVATGQQLEQLYVPGSKEPHILAYHNLKSKFCMTRLVPNFSDSSMYTLFEQRIWSGTEFTFMWPNLRVEELYPPSIQMNPALCPLRKEDFCPFMLWVQGTFRMHESDFDAPITVGFRPLWQDWESNGRTLWNRYYLDYFVQFTLNSLTCKDCTLDFRHL